MSDFTVQELTLGQLLENTAARFPDTDAVIHADRELRQTWSEFSACVDDMARGLMAIGVQKGEKVAVWATNVPHWVTLMFATARIGAILVTVNTNYRETELRYLLQQSECENLFIIDSVRDHDFIASTYEVLPELRRQRRGMLEVEGLPHLKRVFFLGTDKHRGMYSLPELFSLAGDVSDEEYESRKASISPYDVVNMQYTSGTTGFPKGVMLTHVNIVNNGYWIGYHQKFSSRDRVCLPVPLFHCFGCVRRSTYTGIDYYGHTTFGYDDFEQIACTEAFICSDRGTQRHDSCSTGFFEPFAQYGIGLYIWKYDKPHFYQLFGCFQRFYGIG